MSYHIHKPNGYQKVPLLGLNSWLQALRSGFYDQGEGWLCDGSRYCCLGVLSAIQGRLREHRAPGSESWGEGVLAEDNPLFDTLNYEGLLPTGVKVQAGHLMRISLVSLNDDLHLSFSEIADILEELYVHQEPEAGLTNQVLSVSEYGAECSALPVTAIAG